ncbi:MAG: hypothetical protein HFH63_02235 [Lachnospiraceae bacterium]|nr:hypothetical protein [Lachnospiraceae bacterium]
MAWTGLTLTVEGRNALNQAQIANRINFKSIVVGDGKAPANFRTLKELVHQLYEITDIKVDMTEDGCTVTADFPKVDYDYYFREIGIIVTTDEGDRLYVYDNCGEDAQYMVNSTGVETTKKRIRLALAISDVEEITVSAAEILYVAYDDYEETVEVLKQNLKEETERAEAAEGSLTENLRKEINRAQTAEETNKNNLVNHVADKTNPHKVTKVQVGLGNVDNTADMDKPVSTAQQEALDRHIGNNAVHITEVERTNWNDANTKKHTHSNKGVLDKITQVLLDSWNAAYTHISDAVKHITAAERTLWNTVSNKVDKVSGKGLSTNDYTTAEKNKLAGIAANANNYTHPTTAGNKHIPSGGSSGQILRWSADGTVAWGSDNNTTYSTATQSANGLLSAADKKKLDGISEGANKTIVDSSINPDSVNPVQNKVVKYALDGKANINHSHNYAGSSSTGGSANSAVKLDSSAGSAAQPVYFKDGKPTACTYSLNASVPSGAKFTDTTYSNMTAATASAAGKAGLVPAPAAGKTGAFLRGDGTWAIPVNTNTWRGITDSLTSSDSTISLSAKAGKNLKDSIDTINNNLKQNTAGKFVLPNGLKICWGIYTPPNANGYIRQGTVTFPITFTSAPYVFCTKVTGNSAVECVATVGCSNQTATSVVIKAMAGNASEVLADRQIPINWIAIGY